MPAPDRVSVFTCIACGAMELPGTCATGCTDVRLDLVREDDLERVEQSSAALRRACEALERAAERLVALDDDPQVDEDAFAAARAQARAALTALSHEDEDDEPSVVTAWWCPACGGVDAPQPCLGVCIRPRITWVNAAIGEARWEEHEALRARRERLESPVRVAATVTPRPGRWRPNLQALAARIRAATEPGPAPRAADAPDPAPAAPAGTPRPPRPSG
jgi:hypothetical protein